MRRCKHAGRFVMTVPQLTFTFATIGEHSEITVVGLQLGGWEFEWINVWMPLHPAQQEVGH